MPSNANDAAQKQRENEAREAAAREAAAREAARKAAIYEKIRTLQIKVNQGEELCEELQTSKNSIDNEISEWEGLNNNKNQSEIIKYVKVIDVFEGIIAENLAQEFTHSLAEMDKNKVESEDLSDKVNNQIGRLRNYISKLRSDISSLYASL